MSDSGGVSQDCATDSSFASGEKLLLLGAERLLLPWLRLFRGHPLPVEMARHTKLKCDSKN